VSSLDKVKDRPVGVLSRSGAEALLKERGFTRVRPQPEEWLNARQMQQRRIDAWLAPRLMVIHAMREVGGNLEALNFGEIVRKSEIYLAASKDLPDAEAQKWEKALAAVQADGTYRRIADEYNRMKIVIPDEMRRRFTSRSGRAGKAYSLRVPARRAGVFRVAFGGSLRQPDAVVASCHRGDPVSGIGTGGEKSWRPEARQQKATLRSGLFA
jgi:hypothetical protein